MSREDYYKNFSLAKVDKKILRNEELHNLYRRVKKDKGSQMPKSYSDVPFAIQQADLCFLSNDQGYRYALVVTDIATKLTDSVALKDKTAETVLKGLKDIWSGKILKKPILFQCDPGTEFKGVVAQWLAKNSIGLRVGAPNRHRQQSAVEAKNGIIAKQIGMRQTASELLTGETSREWIKQLPEIIRAMNKRLPKEIKPPKEYDFPKDTVVIPAGSIVRVALDEPISTVDEKREHGHFRASDIRWHPKHRIVRQILMQPFKPIMYLLDGPLGEAKVDNVAYTYNQLQLVPKDEQDPIGDLVVKADATQYRVKKVLGEKIVKGKKFYLVSWRGYTEQTYEPASEIKKKAPELIKEYEKEKEK